MDSDLLPKFMPVMNLAILAYSFGTSEESMSSVTCTFDKPYGYVLKVGTLA